MPSKTFELEDGLEVTISKRRNNRNLKLSMSAKGDVKVTIPHWAPYSSGVVFAKTKIDWIKQNRPVQSFLFDGQSIGKSYKLHFILDQKQTKAASRVTANGIFVKYQGSIGYQHNSVQSVAQKACVRALRAESLVMLPPRLLELANEYGYDYNLVNIRQLKGRWGSCDQAKNITLNLFLMQLPWELIDYVLLHELAHTRILRHGPDFWNEMIRTAPNAKLLRKKLHEYQPVLK